MMCKECEHFKTIKPDMPFQEGIAVCKKHNLITEFFDNRKINRLVCVEGTEEEKSDSSYEGRKG